jgi:hypothetical protein
MIITKTSEKQNTVRAGGGDKPLDRANILSQVTVESFWWSTADESRVIRHSEMS